MSRRALLSILALCGALGAAALAQDPVAEMAAQAELAARTEENLSRLRESLKDDTLEVEARVELWRSLGSLLRRIGRYEEALEELEAARATRDDATLQLEAARNLVAVGYLSEAEDLLEMAVDGGSLEARYEIGRLLIRRGEVGQGRAHLYGLIDAYNRRADSLSAAELVAVGDACRDLGAEDPQLFKDALRAYDQAIAADPSFFDARVAVAELFLEKYNSTQARQELETVLQADPTSPSGHLAMARVLDFDGHPAAQTEAGRALQLNPNHVPSRVFLAMRLLEVEKYDEAEAEALRALDVDPVNLEALAALAAAHYLRGAVDEFAAVEERVMEMNPRYAGFYTVLADACVRNRFYREAVAFARQAIEVEPLSWEGWGLLGLNELRIGRIAEGRANLERAFEGDPYNVWIKNTLDLVDTWDEFRSSTSPRFEFVAHEREHDLLSPYALALAEEAYDVLSERYGIEPPSPIRLEFYEADADFSVRTIGLAGMGALGVCFGEVVAQDSPRARPQGTFNWGSTLWHEIAHSFTLAASAHRVPRWLTEGLSVLEERRARPGWGDDIDPRFLSAWRDDQLLPMSRLNDGFVRPKFPEQIGLSYQQASYVCELIERDHGFEAILGLLHGYRDGESTKDVFTRVLEMSFEDFDDDFEDYLEERFASSRSSLGELAAEAESEEAHAGDAPPDDESDERQDEGLVPPPEVRVVEMPTATPTIEDLEKQARERPGHFPTQMAYAAGLLDQGDEEEAVAVLEAAKLLFPEYTDEGSAYHLLAGIYDERGEREKAAAELESIVAINENDYRSRLRLGELRGELGDSAGAAAALEEAVFVYPYDARLFELLSAAHESLGQTAGVVDARRSLVALDPVDRAGALFDLAVALDADGRYAESREAVLEALELAPTYEPAQRLLLRLHREQKAAPGKGDEDGRIGS